MTGNNTILWITRSDINDARLYTANCEDVKILTIALNFERNEKNRKTVIRLLESRINKLNKEKHHAGN